VSDELTKVCMARVWAGADAGKTHHYCVVIDADGERLLSRRVANDEPELRGLIGEVTALGEATWAVDLPDGGAALLIGLLLDVGWEQLYIPGRAVNRAAGATGARARPTRGTRRSSLTRCGCAVTCSRCGPATSWPWN
jgi:hypothetical protein